MKNRIFKEDLTAVLEGMQIKRKHLDFPIITTNSMRAEDIEAIPLSVRAKNVLRRSNVNTMQNLMDNFDNIHKFRSCGDSTVKEIKGNFLQWWYENLEDWQVKSFWKDFVDVNS